MKISNDYKKEYVESYYGYTLVSIEDKNVIGIFHECGYIYKTRFDQFKSGRRCYNCSRARKKTDAEFTDDVNKMYPNNEYIFLEKYINKQTKITVKHTKCDYIYKVNPSNFLSGRKCPKCSKLVRKDLDYFKKELQLKHENVFSEITIISPEYTNCNTNLEINCNNCNNYYYRTPDNMIRQGYHCPYCRYDGKSRGLSKPIQEIINIIKSYNIQYILEKSFSDCRRTLPLPFDIYLPKFNLLIEYDGEQHYVGWQRCSKSLKYIQENDNIKTEYCKNNNINLIRINYKENHEERMNDIIINLEKGSTTRRKP